MSHLCTWIRHKWLLILHTISGTATIGMLIYHTANTIETVIAILLMLAIATILAILWHLDTMKYCLLTQLHYMKSIDAQQMTAIIEVANNLVNQINRDRMEDEHITFN